MKNNDFGANLVKPTWNTTLWSSGHPKNIETHMKHEDSGAKPLKTYMKHDSLELQKRKTIKTHMKNNDFCRKTVKTHMKHIKTLRFR